jgi:hypothetical protein
MQRGCAPRYGLGDYQWSIVVANGEPSKAQDAFRGRLPAGRYHLFVIADGAPVSGTLRLGGLHGRTHVDSGSIYRTEIDQPAPSVYSPGADSASPGHLYSAGSTHRGATTGYVFFLHYKVFTGWDGTNQAQVCGFEGPPKDNALGPYEYPCATPKDAFGAAWAASNIPWELHGGYAVDAGGPAGLVPHYLLPEWAFGYYDVPRPVASMGGFINTGSPAAEVETLTLWLDFGGDQVRGPHWQPKPPG